MKVLFIGNSHTYVHYVPVRTAAFCAQMGRPIEIAMLTYPGVTMGWFCSITPILFPAGSLCWQRGQRWRKLFLKR